MNKSEQAIYEAQWSSKADRMKDWYEVLHKLKLELQAVNKAYPHLANSNYLRFLAHCRDRAHDSIAGTIYCPIRNKYIDHFEYISVH